MEMPPLPTIPDGLPDGEFALEPSLSPDGSLLAYVNGPDQFSELKRLYVVNLVNNEARLIYETPDIAGTRWYLAGLCWSSDSQLIRYVLTSRLSAPDSPPTIYSIRRDGSDLQELFTLDELVGVNTGRCSPDGREMVLLQRQSDDDSQDGLYRLNLMSGQWEQILSFYFITRFIAGPDEFQP
jgi:Tol biopolymer transport system component